MTNLNGLKRGSVLHAELKDGTIIHGCIDRVSATDILVDDNVSGDIMVVGFDEIVETF